MTESIKEKVQKATEKVAKATKKDSKPSEIEELKKQLEEAKNDFLRARADFENYRKRTEQEKLETRDKAIISFVESILPSIDNFEMSLKMTDNKDMFIKGVEMIHKNLIDTLKEHHITEFETKIGEEFNLTAHEPILIEDHSKEPGKVLAVIQKGYKHKEKIIRPARVQIAKPKEE